jgi:DNA-3-methyladenine glycosylase
MRSPEVVAPRLLGSVIVSDLHGGRVAVLVTEVEAYGGVGEDPGSHAYRGQTRRNASMFAPAGHLYVYFTYGMHWCANVVTGGMGNAGAVLLRAGRIIEGVDLARGRRMTSRMDHDLASGPARLCVALGLTGDADGVDLLDSSSPVRLEVSRRPLDARIIGPRTGVSGAGAATPWRFAVADPTVSPYRPAQRRPPVRRDRPVREDRRS